MAARFSGSMLLSTMDIMVDRDVWPEGYEPLLEGLAEGLISGLFKNGQVRAKLAFTGGTTASSFLPKIYRFLLNQVRCNCRSHFRRRRAPAQVGCTRPGHQHLLNRRHDGIVGRAVAQKI